MIAFVKVHFGKQHVWKLITLEKFNSGNDCFCKSALWKTTCLETYNFGKVQFWK